MTDKHPTDALPMPEKSFLGTSRFGSIFYGHTDEALRAYGIACHNLGRESMREEAAKKCDQYTDPNDGEFSALDTRAVADACAEAIRSIEL